MKCFLFFSSRRRHTRYIGDWSSDVCSSDLSARGRPASARSAEAGRPLAEGQQSPGYGAARAHARSEERRVGKERRPGWPRYTTTNEKSMYLGPTQRAIANTLKHHIDYYAA